MTAIPDYASIIAKLETALASGVLTARDGDMSFQFRNVSELKEAIAYWKAQRDTANGAVRGSSVVYFGR